MEEKTAAQEIRDELDERDLTLADLGLTELPPYTEYDEIPIYDTSTGCTTIKRVKNPPVRSVYEPWPGVKVRCYTDEVDEEGIKRMLREEAKEIRDEAAGKEPQGYLDLPPNYTPEDLKKKIKRAVRRCKKREQHRKPISEGN